MADDPDIANWVLEFLLRQPIEYRILNSLLQVLPIRNNDSSLKRLILLKKLEYDASRNSISENALELLEQLEELKFQNGDEKISDSMKRAYCAVAVKCTVTVLANKDEDGGWKYFEVVKRVWRKRIGRMEKGGLWSEELCVWKEEFQAAIWDDESCENVVKKGNGVNAVEAVYNYVKEERENMGPSFLELVAARMKFDEVMQRIPGLGSVDRVTSTHTEKNVDDTGLVKDCRSGDNEGKAYHRKRTVDLRLSPTLTSRNSKGAKIVNSDQTTAEPSFRDHSSPHSAKTDRAMEALSLSLLELKAVVKDPLPEAINYARAIAGRTRENSSHDPVVENHNEANLPSSDAGVARASNVPKQSLMEKNASAHTYEWEDSIEDSQEEPPNRRSRLTLPSPRAINVSPLQRYNFDALKRRRRPRKWSVLEEDTLRTAVQRYGTGNWKVILTTHSDVFEDRTEVDLKDKWRNLTR